MIASGKFDIFFGVDSYPNNSDDAQYHEAINTLGVLNKTFSLIRSDFECSLDLFEEKLEVWQCCSEGICPCLVLLKVRVVQRLARELQCPLHVDGEWTENIRIGHGGLNGHKAKKLAAQDKIFGLVIRKMYVEV